MERYHNMTPLQDAIGSKHLKKLQAYDVVEELHMLTFKLPTLRSGINRVMLKHDADKDTYYLGFFVVGDAPLFKTSLAREFKDITQKNLKTWLRIMTGVDL